jgi:S-DNA-T family DNA segregation ATPase FtsK/SpoIIIE
MLRQLIGAVLLAIDERKRNKMTYKKPVSKVFTTPPMKIHPQVMEWAKCPHILIAGATGSGKSVLINLFIHDLLSELPGDVSFILIDPKRVELSAYKNLPHTLLYASEKEQMFHALNAAVKIMEDRYAEMQQAGLKKYTGGDLYVIIDEFADLMVTDKKRTEQLIVRLAQLGRAARVHLLIATQRPTREFLTGAIKCNIDNRFALHCASAQDSRNIIGANGAEKLAMYGSALYFSPSGIEEYDIPMISDDEINRVVTHWNRQN